MSIEWVPDTTMNLLVIYFVYFVLFICWAGLGFILNIFAILKHHFQSFHFALHQNLGAHMSTGMGNISLDNREEGGKYADIIAA